jgi:hypothetical protein
MLCKIRSDFVSLFRNQTFYFLCSVTLYIRLWCMAVSGYRPKYHRNLVRFTGLYFLCTLNSMGSAVTIHKWHLLCYLSSLCQQQQDKQCAYKRDIEVISRKYFCSGKAVSVEYFESVCNHIRHARRFRHIVVCAVSASAILSTLSHKRHFFFENIYGT